MATLNVTLELTSTDVFSDTLSLSNTDALTITKSTKLERITTSTSTTANEIITIEKADAGDEYLTLGAGEFAFFPWASEVDLFADSATGTPVLEVGIFEA